MNAAITTALKCLLRWCRSTGLCRVSEQATLRRHRQSSGYCFFLGTKPGEIENRSNGVCVCLCVCVRLLLLPIEPRTKGLNSLSKNKGASSPIVFRSQFALCSQFHAQLPWVAHLAEPHAQQMSFKSFELQTFTFRS